MQQEVDRRRVTLSVGAFFVLAMGLGAGTVALVVQGAVPPQLALASALSASTAGVIMTAVEDGRAGLKLMLRRLLIWRVGMGYWHSPSSPMAAYWKARVSARLNTISPMSIGTQLDYCTSGQDTWTLQLDDS